MKRFGKIFALGVGLGLILLGVQTALQIDREAFVRGYWKLAPVLILAAVLFNVCYNIFYQRKMSRAGKLLSAGQTAEYIAEVERLVQTAKGRSLRNILRVNLAAGYIEAKEYERAVSLLEELSGERLSNAGVKMCHRLNLCMAYFYTGRYDEAVKVYQDSERILRPYRQTPAYGGSIAVVDILTAIQSRELDRAEELLDQAKQTWNTPGLQEAFEKFEGILAELRKEP